MLVELTSYCVGRVAFAQNVTRDVFSFFIHGSHMSDGPAIHIYNRATDVREDCETLSSNTDSGLLYVRPPEKKYICR